MKKISNSIRIGMVPRGDISSKLHEEHSPSNAKEQITSSNNHAPSVVDSHHDQQRMHNVTSPSHVGLHEMNDINTNKQANFTNVKFHQSLPPNRPRLETVSELHEVPTKTKTFSRKKVLLGVAKALVIGSMVIVGVVLGVVLTRPADTTTTVAASPTTTIAPNVISAVWSFDNVTTELYGVYNGSLMNSAIYSNATSQTFPYFGSGQALLLNGANQFVSVSSPFLPLNSTSFTIEAWIYATSFSSDRGIFGQCQSSTCANQCLYFICRGGRLFIGFTLNDLWGTTILSTLNWHHVAFVYNSQTQQQILYVNGIQDAIKPNAVSYQGTNGSIQIGASQVFGSTNYFNGYIDNVWVTTRAKSADEILRDASLIVYYSFDLPNPNADSGPNKILGNSTNTITASGRINQAMRFTGASSYFQMFGLYQVPTAVTTNRPFSVSLWINPTISGSCTFVQLFSASSSPCVNLLGISSGSGLAGQIFVLNTIGVPSTLTGPFVTQNVWTHISLTYNASTGYRLYFNGINFGATGNVTYNSGGMLSTLIVGFLTGCSGFPYNIPYQGSIDELYIHNRVLTQAEVTALANL